MIVFVPLITVPVVPNPTVESTDITFASTCESKSALVLPGIVNIP